MNIKLTQQNLIKKMAYSEMRKIDKIIVHCSATVEGKDFKAADIRKWHLQRGFKDIGYHYVVDLDGTIELGRPELQIGAHCSGQNKDSIGICYVGGVDKNLRPKDTRTDKQIKSMNKLIKELIDKYSLSLDDVYGHYQFNKFKACPSVKIDTIKRDYLCYII